MIRTYGTRKPLTTLLFVTSILLYSFSHILASPIDDAKDLNQQAIELVQQGRHQEAIPYAEQALEIRKKVLGEEHADTVASYNRLANLYTTLRNFGKAEPLIRRALEISKKVFGEDHPATARSYALLANLYAGLGNYSEAEPIYQKVLAIRKKYYGEEHRETAYTYIGLAGLYKNVGDYAKAEPLYLKVLAIRKKYYGEGHPETARTYIGLAELYTNVGNYGKAESLYLKALEIMKTTGGEDSRDSIIIYRGLQRLYRVLGNYDKVESLILKSLEISRKVFGEDHNMTAGGYIALANLYTALGNYSKAEPLFLKGIAMRKDVLNEGDRDLMRNYNWLAQLYLDTNRPDEALNIWKKTNSKKLLGFYHLKKGEYKEAEAAFLGMNLRKTKSRLAMEDTIMRSMGLALCYEGMGEYGKAKEYYAKTIGLIEEQYKTLEFEDRLGFLAGKILNQIPRTAPYEGMVRVLLKEGKEGAREESLIYAERIKSRTFIEMLGTQGAVGRKEDTAILKQDRAFQERIVLLKKRIGILEELGANAPQGAEELLDKELDQQLSRYESFLQEVKLKGTEVESLIGVESFSLGRIQSLLDPSTTLLEYLTTDDRVYAWLVTKDTIKVYDMDLGVKGDGPAPYSVASLLDKKVNDFLLPNISNKPRKAAAPIMVYVPSDELKDATQTERERNRQRFTESAQNFYKDILSPIEKDIKTKNLIIVPHGALHKVPFAALSDGKQYMADKYALAILPSANVIEYVVKKRKAAKGNILTLANPKTDYVPLGFAETEGKNISDLFPKREVYTLDKATETVAKTKSSSFNIIHFASHGQFNEKQPLQSGLLLARDKENDGFLQVHEIFSLDLKDANLVTLSACETALAKIQGGDDLVGLSRGFIYAGTPSLLATLWEVDDKSTALLMESFYKNWLSGMSKPEALRAAQLDLKKIPQYNHPFYWAPFVMIGDWR